jgi:hypothetical protein
MVPHHTTTSTGGGDLNYDGTNINQVLPDFGGPAGPTSASSRWCGNDAAASAGSKGLGLRSVSAQRYSV